MYKGFKCNFCSSLLPSTTKLRRLCFYTCLSVHKGVCLSACWDTTPLDQAPPWSRHPPDLAPPQGPGTPLGPSTCPPPPDQAKPEQTATVADGTHPTGMHSCLIRVHKIGRSDKMSFRTDLSVQYIYSSHNNQCSDYQPQIFLRRVVQ